MLSLKSEIRIPQSAIYNLMPHFNFLLFPAEKFIGNQIGSIQTISIRSMTGQLVSNFHALNNTEITLELGELEKGLYLLEINSDNIKKLQKLIIK